MHPFRFAKRPTVRGFAVGSFMWVFGLAASLLLGSLWGRAVTEDRPTLETTAAHAVENRIVADRLTAWAGEILVAAADELTLEQGEAIVRAVWGTPEGQRAVRLLTSSVVDAALAPAGSEVVIDAAPALAPLVDELTQAFRVVGNPVERGEVEAVIDRIQPLTVIADDQLPMGAVVQVRRFLTQALLVAAATMIVAGLLALAISANRAATVRALALRMTLTALSFAVMLRVGAWALDPSGGAAPLRRGGSVLLGSNVHVPLLVAAIAAASALGAGLLIWRRGLPSGDVAGPTDLQPAPTPVAQGTEQTEERATAGASSTR